MESPNGLWVFVVDEGRGRLMQGKTVRIGRSERSRLALVATVENPWHELDRASRARQNGHDVQTRHKRAELLGRFARDVARWLDDRARSLPIEELFVFAPARLLGLLRESYTPNVAKLVHDQKGDLGTMSLGELEQHRLVSAVLHPAR